ncbi:hypothetical protein PLESTM_000894100 [Pleodorina starrii]|nr:hypothetical protein PLESTM_000894100 [Pleodorina starrii]
MRLDSHFAQPQRPPQQSRAGHLVQLMDGDDVRLALQALQLAAQIHDHMWGTAGPTAADDPRRRREALLEAAEPLYDTAMAAARAIQHRALHSLVKQAVRRYVNPGRGSPDDVLQVILELLTGCGGAVAAAAQPPPSAGRAAAVSLSSASASRCFREAAVGGRPGRRSDCPVPFLPGRLSAPECGDRVGSRCDPICHHHHQQQKKNNSFGSSSSSSSLSGRSSTRSSSSSLLDSGGSDTYPSCLPVAPMLRA